MACAAGGSNGWRRAQRRNPAATRVPVTNGVSMASGVRSRRLIGYPDNPTILSSWNEDDTCLAATRAFSTAGSDFGVPIGRSVCSQPKVPDRTVRRANPNQANGKATTQRPAIGRNAVPAYLAYMAPDTRVSSAVTSPEPNAYRA